MPVTAVRTALSPGRGRPSGPKVCVQSATGMRSIVALTCGGQRPSRADGIPPAVAALLRGWRLANLRFSPTPAIADNRLRAEGGAMPRLDDTAIEEGLQHLPGWERRGSEIVKTFVRADFAQAMVFVNEVAGAAEAAGHHPDIDIRWNKVTLVLSSQAEGGLADHDVQLAARVQELDQPTQPA